MGEGGGRFRRGGADWEVAHCHCDDRNVSVTAMLTLIVDLRLVEMIAIVALPNRTQCR